MGQQRPDLLPLPRGCVAAVDSGNRCRCSVPAVKRAPLAAAAVAAILSPGCASLQFTTDGARTAELSWLAMHAVDTAQTVTIARSPQCLWEGNPLAVAVYGSKHPSVARVVATNTAMAGLHWAAGAWLDKHAEQAMQDGAARAPLWYLGRGAFYALSFAGTGRAVLGNVQLGVRPLSRARCSPG